MSRFPRATPHGDARWAVGRLNDGEYRASHRGPTSKDGVKNQRVLVAIARSAETGRSVTIEWPGRVRRGHQRSGVGLRQMVLEPRLASR
jgi:hypothetical protein